MCRLLACDFDGSSWILDALAFYDAANAMGLQAALERSKSGDGAHVWTFFREAVPAASARRIGFHLLREAMTIRAEIDLSSYDRFFPAQDTLPKGTYGNLIALPLQGSARQRGTTVFLDPSTLKPYHDQWEFLASIVPSSAEAIAALGSQLVSEISAGPLARRPPRRASSRAERQNVPGRVVAAAGAMLAIDRIGLPAPIVADLKHLASLHNPKFYENERLRFSNHATPRFIRAYQESLDQLLIPRGLREAASDLIAGAGSALEVKEQWPDPSPLGLHLSSELTAAQRRAFDDLVDHDLGVLVAPPGSGKTIVACALIAHRDRPTLVIVDRKPLVDQWRDRLGTHLRLSKDQIGKLGDGHDRQRGVVDIAMAQGLARRHDLEDVTAGYGLVVIDECHHVPAVTFERCVRQIPVRRWLGLTATPYRRDGLEGLIAMYCGPIRHDSTRARGESEMRLELFVHPTAHEVPADELSIQEIFRTVVEDGARNAQIGDDVIQASRSGRNCLVLTQWTEHLESLVKVLEESGATPIVLRGGMGKKARARVFDELAGARPGDGTVLVATGGYLGEGFDSPPLDTLFLTFPLAFKGRLVQYVGRVMRSCEAKDSVQVHDYVDGRVPVVARMLAKRLPILCGLGFERR